jgi:hypothetical protein
MAMKPAIPPTDGKIYAPRQTYHDPQSLLFPPASYRLENREYLQIHSTNSPSHQLHIDGAKVRPAPPGGVVTSEKEGEWGQKEGRCRHQWCESNQQGRGRIPRRKMISVQSSKTRAALSYLPCQGPGRTVAIRMFPECWTRSDWTRALTEHSSVALCRRGRVSD